MSKQPKKAKRPDEVEGQSYGEIFEPEPRDYLYALESEFDIDAQLIAIRGLLKGNRNAAAKLSDEIKQTEEHIQRLKGFHADWAVDDWVDQIHRSAYQEAAHSMSAIGMLAPFVETVFYQYFRGIGNRFYPATHPLSGIDPRELLKELSSQN